MEQLRAQLLNYLDWLESRGLAGTTNLSNRHIPSSSALLEPSLPGADPLRTGIAQNDSNAADGPRQSFEQEQAPPIFQDPGGFSQASDRTTSAGAGQTASQVERQTLHSMPSAQAGRSTNWKIGFYSSSDLTEQEYIMVSRIALALGLPPDDFRIWAEDSLVRVPEDLLRCSYFVALGPGSGQTLLALGQTVAMNTIQKALQGSPLLTIPHPRAMLRDPKLKAGAWTALQKFKALLVH